MREEETKKAEERDAAREKDEEERETKAQALEDQIKAEKERILKAEQEMWQHFKTASNFDSEVELNSEFDLGKFTDHIKLHKVVHLQELAAQFKLKNSEVI